MVSSQVGDSVVPTTSSDSELHIIETECDVPDVRELAFAEVLASGDSVLAHAVARLVDDIQDPDEVVAGFQSAL